MHASGKLDVYGETLYALLLGCVYQGVEQFETVYFRLKVVLEKRVECRHFRIHYNNACCDAGASQVGSFVGHGHGKVVYAAVLQSFGYFNRTSSVCRGFDHAGDFCLGFHERTVEIEILGNGFEIDIECGFVHTQ